MSALPQALRPPRFPIGPQQTSGYCSVLSLVTVFLSHDGGGVLTVPQSKLPCSLTCWAHSEFPSLCWGVFAHFVQYQPIFPPTRGTYGAPTRHQVLRVLVCVAGSRWR